VITQVRRRWPVGVIAYGLGGEAMVAEVVNASVSPSTVGVLPLLDPA
jgi:hypothetical protein